MEGSTPAWAQETMRANVRRVELSRSAKLLERGGLIVQVVLGCTESVVRIRPLGFQPQSGLELFRGLPGVAGASSK